MEPLEQSHIFLTDGIYPEWKGCVKSFLIHQGEKKKYFAQIQEGVRKDVQRAFGVLQARFAILSRPCLL